MALPSMVLASMEETALAASSMSTETDCDSPLRATWKSAAAAPVSPMMTDATSSMACRPRRTPLTPSTRNPVLGRDSSLARSSSDRIRSLSTTRSVDKAAHANPLWLVIRRGGGSDARAREQSRPARRLAPSSTIGSPFTMTAILVLCVSAPQQQRRTRRRRFLRYVQHP